ncbi:MAG: hypothetical protein OIF50_09455 [Flavobacteriaceae bacterium]|nr:hypothetical protein [Flavobacteriaceae bacterium]
MNRIFFTLCGFAFLLMASCSSDSIQRNPYLIEPSFAVELNTSLPLYAPLNISGNAIFVSSDGVGIRGIIVANFGDIIYAWEAACPNHELKNCSTMEIKDGIFAKCKCDDLQYSLTNGAIISGEEEGVKYFNMISYRSSKNGSVIRVFN